MGSEMCIRDRHDVIDSDDDELLIVRFNVTVLSHPTAFVPVQVYTPDAVYVVPFQYKLSHDEIDTVDDDELLIVRFNTAELSHPTAFVPIQVYAPDDVYVFPFQA